MNSDQLLEKISTGLLGGVDELHKIQKDVGDKYRINPVDFWTAVKYVTESNKQIIKVFIGGMPEKEFVNVEGVNEVVDGLDKILSHAEKQIVIHSVNTIKN